MEWVQNLDRSGHFRGLHGLECWCGGEHPTLESCPNCGQLAAFCDLPVKYFVDPTPTTLGDERMLDGAQAWEAPCPKCGKVSLRDFVGVLKADLDSLGWRPGDYL
jgi:predicted RNA-binding Zn-ribbon protein involved in translation (DUF1610 family)